MMKRMYFRWKHNNQLDYVIIDDRREMERLMENKENLKQEESA